MNVFIIIAGVQPQPLHLMAKAHMRRDRHWVTVTASFDAAIEQARTLGHLLPTE
jgi:hypothetical protein